MRELPAMHRVLAEPAIAEYEATLGRATVKHAVEREFDRVRISGVAPSMDELVAAVASILELERLQGLIPVDQRDGDPRAHELGPRAACARGAGRGRAARARLYESRIRSGGGRTRLAVRARDVAAVRADRRAGCAGGQQLRGGRAARAGYVCQRARGDRRAQPARRDRRRLPHSRRPRTQRRLSARSRRDQQGVRRRISNARSRPQTALLLRVHPSNYSIEGFTHDVSASELAALGARVGVPVVEDLGSGALVDLAEYGLPHERTVAEARERRRRSGRVLGRQAAGRPAGRRSVRARQSDRAAARQPARAGAARR